VRRRVRKRVREKEKRKVRRRVRRAKEERGRGADVWGCLGQWMSGEGKQGEDKGEERGWPC
jgi:hypothetical protein